jgi:hypothetical protein
MCSVLDVHNDNSTIFAIKELPRVATTCRSAVLVLDSSDLGGTPKPSLEHYALDLTDMHGKYSRYPGSLR